MSKKLYVDRFNPAWDSDEDADAAFADAAVFARGILMREIKKAASDFMAEDIIREAVRKTDKPDSSKLIR